MRPLGALAAALLLALAPQATASVAGDARPVLRIGLTYVPPPRTPNAPPHAEEGFETVVAQDIGRSVGGEVELVPVPGSERAAALAEGRVDAIIARLGEGDDLGVVADVVPSGFESGQNVAMPTFTTVRRWSDLKGRSLCVSQGNEVGQRFGRTLGAELRVVPAPSEGLIMLREGKCDASIHDAALLEPLLRKREWAKFSSTLTPAEPTALVVAVSKANPALAGRIRTALAAAGTAGHAEESSQGAAEETADEPPTDLWTKRRQQWAADVAFEVYLNQLGSDCH